MKKCRLGILGSTQIGAPCICGISVGFLCFHKQTCTPTHKIEDWHWPHFEICLTGIAHAALCTRKKREESRTPILLAADVTFNLKVETKPAQRRIFFAEDCRKTTRRISAGYTRLSDVLCIKVMQIGYLSSLSQSQNGNAKTKSTIWRFT